MYLINVFQLYNTKKRITIMDFIELAKKRYSVRKYLNKQIESEKSKKILQAAHATPTAVNLQPIHLIVVQTEKGLQRLKKLQASIMHHLQLLCTRIIIKHGSAHLIRNKPVALMHPF